MLLLQSSSSRYIIHRERAVPVNVKHRAAELCKVEKTGQVFEA